MCPSVTELVSSDGSVMYTNIDMATHFNEYFSSMFTCEDIARIPTVLFNPSRLYTVMNQCKQLDQCFLDTKAIVSRNKPYGFKVPKDYFRQQYFEACDLLLGELDALINKVCCHLLWLWKTLCYIQQMA